MYHAHYDNLMLIPVLLLLFQQVQKQNYSGRQMVFFVMFWLSLLIPARFLDPNSNLGVGLIAMQTLLWLSSAYILHQNLQKKQEFEIS
jgi:hypothetical protein